MPRNGSGVYAIPDGTHGVEATTIESAKYNTYVDDVEFDLNHARPIIAGGTGAVNAVDAMTNLNGEIAKQLITNFDADILYPGSFWAQSTATAAPVAGHSFTGWIYGIDEGDLVIQARDLNDTVSPGRLYVRTKLGGTWGPWKTDGRNVFGDAEGISSETGDMFFGIRGVAPASRFVVNDKYDASGRDIFYVSKNNVACISPSTNANAAFYPSAGGITLSSIDDANTMTKPLDLIGSAITVTGPTTLIGKVGVQGDIYAIRNANEGVIFLGETHFLHWTGSYYQMPGGKLLLGAQGTSGNDAVTFDQLNTKQATLGFTPVQQGGGAGMATNKIYIGWNGSQLIAQVDGVPQGALAFVGNTITNLRLILAGSHNHTDEGQTDPFAGAAACGFGFPTSTFIARYRYLQMYVNGTWYTTAYVG